MVVSSPSSHPFSQTQGRPKRVRRPAGGVFTPGWAPDPALTAHNDSARASEEDGEDGEDSGDADDAASLDGVSDGEESEEDEEDSDEDSGKGPGGAGGGAGGVASAGDENSDLDNCGYAPSEAGDTDGDTDEDIKVFLHRRGNSLRGVRRRLLLRTGGVPHVQCAVLSGLRKRLVF